MTTAPPPAGGLLADLLIGVDHVGMAVTTVDDAGSIWARLLGHPVAHRELVPSQRVEAAFIDLPDGGAALELVAPAEGNQTIQKFLERRGQGLHHLALAVRDLDEALRRLRAAAIPLIDETPRPGARGHRVAFLHPKATPGILLELVERAG